MKLNFLINENYLIYHTLKSAEPGRFSSEKCKKDIVEFQNYAWEVSKDCYNFLIGRVFPDQLCDENIKQTVSDLPSFLKKLKQSTQFKKILQQTKNYMVNMLEIIK